MYRVWEQRKQAIQEHTGIDCWPFAGMQMTKIGTAFEASHEDTGY